MNFSTGGHKSLVKTFSYQLFSTLLFGPINALKYHQPLSLALLVAEYFIYKLYIVQNAWTSLIIHNRRSGKFQYERAFNRPE